MGERHHALRQVPCDDQHFAIRLWHHLGQIERRGRGRQAEKRVIQERSQFFGGDIADDGHAQRIAGETLGNETPHVVDADGLDAFGRAVDRAAIGMSGEHQLAQRPPRDHVGVLGILREPDLNLTANTFHRLFIEARLAQGQTQQVESRLPVFRQGAQAALKSLQPRIEAEPDGEVLQRRLKGLRIELAGALVNEAGR